MKKILATLLTAAMLLSVSACGNEGGSADGSDNGTSAPTSSAPTSSASEGSDNGTQAPAGEAGGIEGYPASLNDWTGQQFIDYFKSVGVFNDGGGEETWLQNHAEYWPGSAVSECPGFWDENGFKSVMIFIFRSDLPDSSEEAYNNDLKAIRENKEYLPEGGSFAVKIDHLAGNVAFNFGDSIDEEFIEEMEKAYQELITKMGATADF